MTAILWGRENWIADRLVSEYFRHNPDTAVDFFAAVRTAEDHASTEPEVITMAKALTGGAIWIPMPWVLQGATTGRLVEPIFEACRLTVTIHHIVPEKFFNEKSKIEIFKKLEPFVDTYHVTNKKTKETLEQVTNKNITLLPFWSNPDVWHPLQDRSALKESLRISEDKFVIGSFQRDTEGSDLKSPKLEKGPDTFCDIIEKLYHTGKQGKEIQLVLAGYNRQYVINRLRETCSNLEVLYFERIPGQHLNALYNCLDLYVVSSRIEGGPQALVEASLARCPIVSTDVGIATEILPPESIYSDADDFHLAVPNVEVAYKNALKLAPDTDIFEKYKKMFYGS